NVKLSLEDKVKRIDETIQNYESDFLTLPSKEGELIRLKRVYDVEQKFYQMLLEKKVEFSITMAGVVSNNIVLERAYPGLQPVSPNRKLAFAGSLLIAFI